MSMAGAGLLATCNDIINRRLLDHAGIGVRRRQSRFLRVRLRVQIRQKISDGLRVGQRPASVSALGSTAPPRQNVS